MMNEQVKILTDDILAPYADTGKVVEIYRVTILDGYNLLLT